MNNLEIRIAELEAIIEHLKGTLVAEYAQQYRDDGERGSRALEMAKEDAEQAITTAMNTAVQEIKWRYG